MDLKGKRVWVAGHKGMVGAALVRRLLSENCEILTADRQRLNLLDQAAAQAWMSAERPDAVFLAAAKVGGIAANNTYRGAFLYENLMLAANVIEAARRSDVGKLIFLGSSCIYPKEAPQPMREDALLTAPLEPTNEPYAIAKIAGLKLCESYRRQYGCDFTSVMPSNLYGPGDNFHPENSHVPAALLRRFHEAKESGARSATVWGSGAPRREFLHVDDLADACVFLMSRPSGPDFVNVGVGSDITIAEFARAVARVVGFGGELIFDRERPDGAPRKLLDTSRLTALGWTPRIGLEEGLHGYYKWFLKSADGLRCA